MTQDDPFELRENSMSDPVVTRFAPSPTGQLHIGGVRTALFSWLFTRQHNGKFILRIDDTDTERNKVGIAENIMRDLSWLGIDWDEGPYYQSSNLSEYKKVALRLVQSGEAYPCIDSPLKISQMKSEALRREQNFVFRGQARNQSPLINMTIINDGDCAIRLRVPNKCKISIQDLVKGKIVWQTDDLGDPVILRPNGTPTYNFATVVDDWKMGITHVIRGEEHLSNTPIQCLLYGAIEGTKRPTFAHLPYVAGPNSTAKLSKRCLDQFESMVDKSKLERIGLKYSEECSPVVINYYRELGYIPEAIINYLARLGWSLDDKTEVISVDDLIKNFDFERVKKSYASFDPKKLEWLAGEYMRKQSFDDKAEKCLPYLQKAELLPEDIPMETLSKYMEVLEKCQDRLKTYSDILDYGAFFFKELPDYDPDAVRLRLTGPTAMPMLERYATHVGAVSNWKHDNLELDMKGFCGKVGGDYKVLIHAVRVALTGQRNGPSLFDLMEIMGRNEVTHRLKHAMKVLPQMVDMVTDRLADHVVDT